MKANLLRLRFFFVIGALVLAFSGCDSNKEEEEQQRLPNGFLTARVDGQLFTANASVFALNTGGVFGLSGVDASGRAIGLGGTSETGMKTIGMGDPANASITEGAALWAANATIGSGTVTITELDAEHIAGTFSFVAPATPGTSATGTRTVTQGEFDIEFSPIGQ
jgi:Family of unknown function (DUF6252)